ncbi:MAG: hypothetical protein JHC61_16405 [Burkholderiaceae bacterium]|nr:hypothetical protein [Burkholderiaceae bacterium]
MQNSIFDVAQAAAEYTEAIFTGNPLPSASPPSRWVVPVDAFRSLGMRRQRTHGSLLLSAWVRQHDDDPSYDDKTGEALLRHTFDTRLGAGLVGGISHSLGLSLNLPLYAVSAASALETAADYLFRLIALPTQPYVSAVMPAVSGDSRDVLGENFRAEVEFERLAQSCGVTALPPGVRSFDLLFDDLPGRVTLHPANRLVLVDFFLHDAVLLLGTLRRMVIKCALEINEAALNGHTFAVGLDSRDFVTTTARITLDGSDEDDWPRWLQYQVEQARAVRDLVRLVALDQADFLYTSAHHARQIKPGAVS